MIVAAPLNRSVTIDNCSPAERATFVRMLAAAALAAALREIADEERARLDVDADQALPCQRALKQSEGQRA